MKMTIFSYTSSNLYSLLPWILKTKLQFMELCNVGYERWNFLFLPEELIISPRESDKYMIATAKAPFSAEPLLAQWRR